MKNYRLVEVRPNVFHVEVYRLVWWLPPLRDWMPVTALDCPAVPEYSGSHVAEFDLKAAESYVAAQMQVEQVAHDRRHPPKGFPRVTKTWTVVEHNNG